jgi:hypothetical protein
VAGPALSARSWLRLAGLALAAGVLAALSGVPLYDGVGFPDAPYRFVGKSPAPTSATLTVLIRGGRSAGGDLATAEKGPQLVVQLKGTAVTTDTNSVTVTAEPLAPDGPPPLGSFDSNVYRLAVVEAPSGIGAVGAGSILLRAAVMTRPAPRVLFRPAAGAAWRELDTHTSGRDILRAALHGLGDYALERPVGSKPISLGSSNEYLPALLGLATVGFFVVASRLLRRRHEDTGDEDWDPRPR